jgi:hypothetical protein
MPIYLPIAEIPVDALAVIALSAVIGFIAGLVGIGGGFILTPSLMLMGVPPIVAVATSPSQVAAASVSAALSHFRRRAVDVRLGLVLSIGGAAGTVVGVGLLAGLTQTGQADLVIQLMYVAFLTGMGTLMTLESVRALRYPGHGLTPRRRSRLQRTLRALPLRLRFPASGRYMSVLPPLLLGAVVGALAAIIGVGGGFLLLPAMIYLLRTPAKVLVGTSLMQILVVTALVTVLHASINRAVDLVLALLLMGGGVIGAQYGARLGARLRAEQLRLVLGLVVLATAVWLLRDLASPPDYPFTLGVVR